ncbi:uncharacterized protein LOC130905124 [Corythoichthys intestinalis]|uniref:uncharacterized protein LOC130905124 n=1 Tax=Corythoichthys intestinalis TaxID=161448 RepID=UPI0025A4FBA2|nr:uncharacterized protein LOC130905124 [Corythoichthys intestinalis]XP_057674162.1 uncharacterized protein LOC130905124 [Corythoichthys intestinalis]
MKKLDASGESNAETSSLFSCRSDKSNAEISSLFSCRSDKLDAESSSFFSHHSKSSRSETKQSNRSSAESLSRSSASSRARIQAALAKAVAEATRARLAYAEEEISIKTEKARLEASLDVLHQRKEADAASAKADVMESVAAMFGMEEQNEKVLGFLPTQTNPEQKVSEYINKRHEAEPPHTTPSNYFPKHYIQPYQMEQPSPQLPVFTPIHVQQEPRQHHQLPQERGTQPHISGTQQNAFHSVPEVQQRLNSNHYSVDGVTSDLGRLLAKIQLLCGGLTKFDDKAENYPSWKLTFQSTITDVGLTANEEINLLIKWLGPKSSQYAVRIKAAHIRDPSVGLERIWTRLEEVYGLPEAIESSLFSRIEKLPKLSRQDTHRLQELADLIGDLEVAKQDGHLPGLSYLDTAWGVSKIVEKLPFYLQEKWIMAGSKYKEDHGVTFPPFSFFCEFVRGHARARNDPSFNSSSFRSQFCHTQKRKARK